MYFMFMPSSEIFHFISCSVYNIIKTTKDIFQIISFVHIQIYVKKHNLLFSFNYSDY